MRDSALTSAAALARHGCRVVAVDREGDEEREKGEMAEGDRRQRESRDMEREAGERVGDGRYFFLSLSAAKSGGCCRRSSNSWHRRRASSGVKWQRMDVRCGWDDDEEGESG